MAQSPIRAGVLQPVLYLSVSRVRVAATCVGVADGFCPWRLLQFLRRGVNGCGWVWVRVWMQVGAGVGACAVRVRARVRACAPACVRVRLCACVVACVRVLCLCPCANALEAVPRGVGASGRLAPSADALAEGPPR